ncbi:hypothetical protein C7445_1184 [Alicyclobacillus sacchari]|uniref:Uncharacterized protein n=1 Tax=Alicyclobacillus sacchari TaxID=392010 RepID=A0A4R8LG80_9BACL|nr:MULTISPECIES: hypothetical protein [Alicyclobacillus]TDY42132.1 hypothetical protein C7445_1184 [Alicyclobacillus sacchari]GMA59390.1 hypothetical protein GCM10025858_38930 [Alicyclobacillus sacchari]
MTIRRYVLSYDDEYDREISDVIEQTPKRRRAERVRQLILLGIQAEAEMRGEGGLRQQTPTHDRVPSSSTPQSDSQVNLETSSIGKRPVIPRITPKL